MHSHPSCVGSRLSAAGRSCPLGPAEATPAAECALEPSAQRLALCSLLSPLLCLLRVGFRHVALGLVIVCAGFSLAQASLGAQKDVTGILAVS